MTKSEKCKSCVHTNVCGKDLNTVGEIFVPPHPMLGITEEAWERYKEREAQGFPCDDYLEIITCKDCRFKSLYDDGDTKYYYCALEDRPNRQWSVDDTDYCKWAERREP